MDTALHACSTAPITAHTLLTWRVPSSQTYPPGKRNVRANINRIKTTRSVGGAHGEKAKAAAGDGDGDARTERDMNTSRGGSGTQRKRVGRGERELGTEECTRTPAARCADPYPAPAGASAPTTERGTGTYDSETWSSPVALSVSAEPIGVKQRRRLGPVPRAQARHSPQPNPTQAEVGEGGCAAHPTARARGSHDTSTTTPCSAGLACLDRRRPGTGRPPARARVRRSPVVSTHARVAHS